MHDARASSSEPVGSSVCDVCQGFYDMNNPRGFVVAGGEPYHVYYTYIHHANLVILFASAEAGCTVCKMISHSIRQEARGVHGELEQVIALESAQTNSAHPAQSAEDVQTAIRLAELAERKGLHDPYSLAVHGPGRIILQVSSDGPDPGGCAMDSLNIHVLGTSLPSCFLRYFKTASDATDPNLEHRPSKDLLSEAHISLINLWRRACEAEHESCRRTTCDRLLPTRVLELLDPSDETKGVRLVETGGKMHGTYACLSYCWGDTKTQSGKTTRQNLSSQLQRIPFDELPPTVVDAIRLCCKLGFRFLWVDRLCIVQDDEKDWSQEASRMCEVYSKSALTIAVPVCKESSQSFLAERRKGFREESLFGIITHTEEESKAKSSTWLYDDVIHRSNGPWFLEQDWSNFSTRPNYSENSWLARGWTFQEWMLSPRVLHIDSMTLWDCFEGYANELNRRCMGKAILERSPEGFGRYSCMTWDHLVQEYSGRKVTRVEDRLPAMAGLAACYAQATGHTYLAGLWREDLPLALCWEATEPRGPANQLAPSWSWASVTGGVSFNEYGGTMIEKASISSAFCQYDPPGSLTKVQSAWIDVDSRIGAVTERVRCDSALKAADEWWYVTAMERWDSALKAADEWWYVSLDHENGGLESEIARANVYLLLVCSVEFITTGHYAIVLQGCGWKDDRQCFKRLGFAMLRIDLSRDEEEEFRNPFGPPWEKRVVRLV